MPRNYWFWALRHANRASNIFPLRCDDTITTSHELVFGVQPDCRQLFRLFSTAYLSHSKDNTHPRSSTESHTLQGIAVGYSDRANGMEIYNPSTKKLYTTTVFQLNELNETRNHFNLQYMTDHPGTKIQYKKQNGTTIQGFIIAVPDTKFGDNTATYTARLEDGMVEAIPASLLPTLTQDSDNTTPSTPFPPWISHNKRCTMEYNNTQPTGVFHQLQDKTWEFHKHQWYLPHIMSLPKTYKTHAPKILRPL